MDLGGGGGGSEFEVDAPSCTQRRHVARVTPLKGIYSDINACIGVGCDDTTLRWAPLATPGAVLFAAKMRRES